MRTKNVLLFPGTDALERREDRLSCLKIPTVRRQLSKTQDFLNQTHWRSLDLHQFMISPNSSGKKWFCELVFATLAVQVGLFHAAQEQELQIDALSGLSLGDAARNVCAEVVSMERGLNLLSEFLLSMEKVPRGLSLLIKSLDSIHNVKEQLCLSKFGLYLSVVQTPHQALIAGPLENCLKWQQSKFAKKVTTRVLYPYPLHSPLMNPVAANLQAYLGKNPSRSLGKWPIYSTVFGTKIMSTHEGREEAIANIRSTVNFPETINNIVQEFQKVSFINVGPNTTLEYFLAQMIGENRFTIQNLYGLITNMGGINDKPNSTRPLHLEPLVDFSLL